MIKEIFLPERIGNRRIISRRIVSISLHDDAIYAAQIYARQTYTVIERIASEPYEYGNQESLVAALAKITTILTGYDQIIVALPASIVVIKELEVPFTDQNKIRMILDYEIESMLPFSIEEAIVDFIITESSSELGQAEILVAAVRTQDLQNVLDIYTQAGIDPSVITVDLFSSYSLYQQIEAYQSIKHGSALVDMGLFTTRVSFIQNGKMRMTRQIPRGLMTIVNAVVQETDHSVEEVLELLKSSGISNEHDQELHVILHKHGINFFNDIQFTLNSFSLKANYYEGITKILFTGKAAEIKNFMHFSSEVLQITSEIFDVKQFFSNHYIKNKVEDAIPYWSHYTAALGAAILPPMLQDFTLRRKAFSPTNYRGLLYQVIAALFLTLLACGVTGIMGFIQVNTFKQQIAMTEQRYIKKLTKLLPEKDRPKRATLQSLVKKLKNSIEEKKTTLAPVEQERSNPLLLFSEITAFIAKKNENIKVEEITFEESEFGKYRAEVDGYFKSDKDQWNNWAEVKKRFKESLFLELIEDITESAAAEKGIKFKAKLKLKELSDKEA